MSDPEVTRSLFAMVLVFACLAVSYGHWKWPDP